MQMIDLIRVYCNYMSREVNDMKFGVKSPDMKYLFTSVIKPFQYPGQKDYRHDT